MNVNKQIIINYCSLITSCNQDDQVTIFMEMVIWNTLPLINIALIKAELRYHANCTFDENIMII